MLGKVISRLLESVFVDFSKQPFPGTYCLALLIERIFPDISLHSRAKSKLQDGELEEFRRTLRELAEIGVNPVIIPREWGIKHIPNLLNAYYNKIADEQLKEISDKQALDDVMYYYAKHKSLKDFI
ncbi:hypothetical protein [Ruminiclostridium cellobioparum]|uniref:hypothetical protein n=1 Tax=Ruminiclostridium cellobioparum TaxID=29355 RepID=UPI0004810815|nr:hypothetical protein [Ruminiclostridium cellobioparum]